MRRHERYLQNDTFVQQTLFLGSHDKVVRIVFVVDDVLQVDALKRRRNIKC